MQTSPSTSGLRERKREETRDRMERAAVEIALAGGIEQATVDAISAAANVSPRTFFNYFDSKEDAILGVRETTVAAEAIERHAAENVGAELVPSTIGLLFSVLGPSLPNSSLHRSRMKLIKLHPELLTRRMAQISQMGEQLNGAIVEMLAVDPRFADQTAEERSASAEMILTICGGAFRITVKEWMAAGGRGSGKELQERAVSLVNDTKERLS